VRRFVIAAARAGATARLEELSARKSEVGRYAAIVLEPAPVAPDAPAPVPSTVAT
jgi:hypothetical protein